MITRNIFGIAVLLLILSCGEKNDTSTPTEERVNKTKSAPQYQVITTKLGDDAFGYQILKDGKMIIDQPNIPAIQGNRSFSSEADAQKTGDYLITKLKKGIFPPTLSVAEIDSLNILN